MNKLIGYKKQKETKICIEKLFYNGGSLSHKYTGAFMQVIGTMGRMPDLPAFQYIHYVIVMAPEIFKFIGKPAIKKGEKRVPAGKPLAAIGVISYM